MCTCTYKHENTIISCPHLIRYHYRLQISSQHKADSFLHRSMYFSTKTYMVRRWEILPPISKSSNPIEQPYYYLHDWWHNPLRHPLHQCQPCSPLGRLSQYLHTNWFWHLCVTLFTVDTPRGNTQAGLLACVWQYHKSIIVLHRWLSVF